MQYLKSDFADAEKSFDICIEINDKLGYENCSGSQVLRNAGDNFIELQKYDKAKTTFTKAQTMASDLDQGIFSGCVARVYRHEGKLAQAAEQYQLTLQIYENTGNGDESGNSAYYKDVYGWYLFSIGDLEEAATQF
mmetsp:Transcript_36215/g.32553  ORF Transcript_36215/g.32553 Transcript_36215/m.32553 type:complete len:136 (-) Transcript_36215:1463-1870(-)